MGGMQPITSRDILAWSQVTGTILRPDEVAILRDMDTAYLAAMGQEMREQAARRGPKAHGA